MRVTLCLTIAMLLSLVFALIALIVARENGIPMTGALVWSGGTFIATAGLISMVMNYAGAFDRRQAGP